MTKPPELYEKIAAGDYPGVPQLSFQSLSGSRHSPAEEVTATAMNFITDLTRQNLDRAAEVAQLIEQRAETDRRLDSLLIGIWHAGEGAARIAYERARQQHGEGQTVERDVMENADGQLVRGAIAYAIAYLNADIKVDAASVGWPSDWPEHMWKPSDDPIRNLEKAGGLIAAEIDRLEVVANRSIDLSKTDEFAIEEARRR